MSLVFLAIDVNTPSCIRLELPAILKIRYLVEVAAEYERENFDRDVVGDLVGRIHRALLGMAAEAKRVHLEVSKYDLLARHFRRVDEILQKMITGTS